MEFNANDPIENVIEESLTDAADVVVEDTSTDDVSTDEGSTEVAEVASTDDGQVPSPGAAAPVDGETDDFAKKFGLQANSITGRENRIPYSRVKKIVAKAEKDAETRLRKEFEGTSAPKLTEYETKVKDYEGRLERVAQFETILENDPKQFLGMLSQLPAYKEFFEFVQQAASQADAQPQAESPYLDQTDMPQPDQVLSDGSRVYSLEGLAKRDEWLARKIEQKAIAQAEQRISERYKPIEQQWQSQQEMARMVPVVEKQIAEARQWDQFNTLEPRIVELLRNDKNITLERAYLKAYQEWSTTEREKLSTDRNKVRSEILQEIKSKPLSSSAPAAGVKPVRSSAGPRSMEDIIAASIEEAGLK